MKKIAVIIFLCLYPTYQFLPQEGWFWQNPLPQGNNLRDLYTFSLNTAIAVGDAGTIIKTTNGGESWFSQTSGIGNRLTSVHFSDNNAGWAVGYWGIIINTTNGGKTWTSQTSGT